MSEQKNIIVLVTGMHCKSCELLLEGELSELKGVKKVLASFNKNQVEIFSNEGEQPSLDKITAVIKKAGYKVGGGEKSNSFFSKNKEDYNDLGIAGLFLVCLFLVLRSLGLTNINFNTSGDLTISLVLLIGLVAGVSTCMALVGGLVLGISAKHNKLHPEAKPMQKFRPHLFFNLGRVLGFALLGGLLGSIGSVIQFSAGATGLLTIVIGLVMLLMGLQLLDIFPLVNRLKLTLPKRFSRALGLSDQSGEYSHKNALIAGALTFFLPCGFTQAMQVYAIGSGNFVDGAAVMGLFALGTVPGLLSIGGLSSFVKGVAAKRFFKLAGLVVIIFAVFNISNGFGLAGLSASSIFSKTNIVSQDPNVVLENGVQVIHMTEGNNGYTPNNFSIKKDVPVKWIIDGQAPYSCASTIVLAKYGIKKTLVAGENTIEFTPTEVGKLPFSCSMGMYTGVFNVID